MKLKHRLKLLRILSGFSQELLAERSRIAQQQLTSYERGTYEPKAEAILSLADALLVPPNYLLHGSPPVSGQAWIVPKPRPQTLNRNEKEIRRLFPDFAVENGFNSVITRRLTDGGFFLIGHDNFFNSLLITPKSLYDVFLGLFEGLDIHEVTEDINLSISDIEVGDFSFFSKYEGLHGWQTDLEGLSRALAKRHWLFSARKQYAAEEISLKKTCLKTIYAIFLRETNRFVVGPEIEEEIENLFVKECEEQSLLPPDRINATHLKAEIKKTIESFGMKEMKSSCEQQKGPLVGLFGQLVQDVEKLARNIFQEYFQEKTHEEIFRLKSNQELRSQLKIIQNKLNSLLIFWPTNRREFIVNVNELFKLIPEEGSIPKSVLLSLNMLLVVLSDLESIILVQKDTNT